ncbi:universal stress protein [uncultured Winogradskyella sp.]|uniref:universal stress protein n=1 Tax=uncultured Winogradskyella sp. TaxID=395353 RepID=UPI00262D128A|nr:universal stress protein [uncultured Winogradskyella sp.]
MKNVLLPTDFSDNSWNAIKYAINFFKDTPCNFYVLHVNKLNYHFTEEVALYIDHNHIEEVYTKPAKKKLRLILKRISKLFPNHKNQKFYTLTDYNFFIESIRKTVNEKHIDFIVMGTKGATGLERIILGTNTADVITKVKCNTLAIPENAEFKPPNEIAFPTDYSLTHNLQILEPIVDILEQFNASLKILHIAKTDSSLSDEQQKNKELLEDYFSNHSYSFHYLTNRKVEDAIQCFVESRDINIICMVAKNLNYFQQILFHTRVEKISYHTDRPFLVLHEKNE